MTSKLAQIIDQATDAELFERGSVPVEIIGEHVIERVRSMDPEDFWAEFRALILDAVGRRVSLAADKHEGVDWGRDGEVVRA